MAERKLICDYSKLEDLDSDYEQLGTLFGDITPAPIEPLMRCPTKNPTFCFSGKKKKRGRCVYKPEFCNMSNLDIENWYTDNKELQGRRPYASKCGPADQDKHTGDVCIGDFWGKVLSSK